MTGCLQRNPFTIKGLELGTDISVGQCFRGSMTQRSLRQTIIQLLLFMQAARSGKIPVWFVFSGMGSQWKGMGRDLMEIGVFRESIMKLNAVLEAYDIDLFDCLMTDKKDVFTDVVNTFVGIISVQVCKVFHWASFAESTLNQR